MTNSQRKPAGRPTLANEIRTKADWYRPHDDSRKGRRVYWTPRRIEHFADVMVQWFEDNHTKVSLGAFCWDTKIPPSYLAQFGHKNKYFSYCLQVIKSLLESRLLEMGLAGEIDRVMAIFSLKNVAGWTDKKEISSTIDITSKIVELQLPKKNKVIEIPVQIVEDKIERPK